MKNFLLSLLVAITILFIILFCVMAYTYSPEYYYTNGDDFQEQLIAINNKSFFPIWMGVAFGALGLVVSSFGLWVSYKKIWQSMMSKKIVLSRNQRKWDKWFIDYLAKENKSKVLGAKNAYFIDYSGHWSQNALHEALEQGWTVHLFLKCAEDEKNEYQKHQIATTVERLKQDLGEYMTEKQLIIRYYKQQVSLRLRYFEGLFITYGWYFYLNPVKLNQDESHVIGHDNLSFTVLKNTEDWNDAKEYWDKWIKEFIACCSIPEGAKISETEEWECGKAKNDNSRTPNPETDIT